MIHSPTVQHTVHVDVFYLQDAMRCCKFYVRAPFASVMLRRRRTNKSAQQQVEWLDWVSMLKYVGQPKTDGKSRRHASRSSRGVVVDQQSATNQQTYQR